METFCFLWNGLKFIFGEFNVKFILVLWVVEQRTKRACWIICEDVFALTFWWVAYTVTGLPNGETAYNVAATQKNLRTLLVSFKTLIKCSGLRNKIIFYRLYLTYLQYYIRILHWSYLWFSCCITEPWNIFKLSWSQRHLGRLLLTVHWAAL
jgi:hypothetical protein